MQENSQTYFQNVVLRPHWMQYCLCKLPEIIICLAACTTMLLADSPQLKAISGITAVIMLTYLAYSITDMYRIRYIITAEQILFKHGVFSYTTDYIELYRVYDYRQSRSPLQQLTGLKNVLVMANDRYNPVLNIIGQKNSQDIVSIIRTRVEYNKAYKNVYEIGNRY